MDPISPRPRKAARRTRRPWAAGLPARRDRELGLVREAIGLVATGASTRVVVAGLRAADDVLRSARALALEAGVRARAVARPDGTGIDVAVERIRE